MFSEFDILARTIYGEARGESYDGKKAVAHVVLNRVDKGMDNTIASACLRNKQFSCWNKSDQNFIHLTSVNTRNRDFRDCLRASLEAYDEKDFTKGATHYHTLQVAPNWSKGKEPCLRLGNHLFFNGID